MRRASLLSFAFVLLASTAYGAIGDPIAGLTPQQLTSFNQGRTAFMTHETAAEGLGPVFNEDSCATCHTTTSGSLVAVGGNTARVETRFGAIIRGAFDPLSAFGGSLLQDHSIGRVTASSDPTCALPFTFSAEAVPLLQDVPNATLIVTAGRRTTPLFGLGFVDAVPDATLIALASSEKSATPQTAGVVSFVTNPDDGTTRVGRFGWKAQNATLHAFSGDAYLNEMGVTSPSFPHESCPQGDCSLLACDPRDAGPEAPPQDDGTDVDAFTSFMTVLDAPPRGPLAPSDKEGEKVFSRIGCADCHTPTLQTGASAIAALASQTFHPYSDFLLHDMGSLGDGITQNGATGALLRTTPLWGLRFQTTLLHDGRATTYTAAIHAHDGQGAAARAKFDGLNATQKGKLLAFLNSL